MANRAAANNSPLSFDIFCKVIDNFGDVGVAWRFAHQLAHEHLHSVRLIIDNLTTLKHFVPSLDLTLPRQSKDGIVVLDWNDPSLEHSYGDPANVCIETFGCSIPAEITEKMKRCNSQWIDLHYLSAESWVPRFHSIPSPEPQSGLERTLYFPGFTTETGGLIREENLLRERDEFQGDINLQNIWRRDHSLPDAAVNSIDISLFCYPSAPVHLLAATLAESPNPVRIFLTEGVPRDTEQIFREIAPEVSLFSLPFLSLEDFDRLLWTCSLNLVRGEDSFVRAIWAGRPFLWNIYPQEKSAHLVKLRAFLDTYGQESDDVYRHALEKILFLWNEGGSEKLELLPLLSKWEREARNFTKKIATQTDLVTNLLTFLCRERT